MLMCISFCQTVKVLYLLNWKTTLITNSELHCVSRTLNCTDRTLKVISYWGIAEPLVRLVKQISQLSRLSPFYIMSYGISLKGQCHEIFFFWFFSWISFPPAPEYPIKTVSNFFENSRRYSEVKVHHRDTGGKFAAGVNDTGGNLPLVSTTTFATGINDTGGKFRHQFRSCCWYRCQRLRRQIFHRCQWHRWQIMGTISGCWDLKLNLKAKCIYSLTLLPKGVKTK